MATPIRRRAQNERSPVSSSPITRVATALAVGAVVAFPIVGSAQQVGGAARFHRYVGVAPRAGVVPAQVRAGLERDKPTTVVVQMSADSVAEARARAPDHRVTAEQHERIAAAVALQHQAIEPEIVARGGRVLARFHDALNGVKVRINADQVEALRSAPGVVAVRPVRTYRPLNIESVPFVGAPQAWQGTPGFRGEGVKIAIIDTGIDYTHADFGGPGTAAAFITAAATSTLPADPALFGPNAPKVKGGYDFAGDGYDASNPAAVPQPDPNPLDCAGHGTHVSGTAAGFGVNPDGTTFHGPYNAGAYAGGFLIGPGVAPKADLYAVRVFGCQGSTNLVVEAIDWAVHNDMDVISMSLGADFAPGDEADAVASSNAVRAGIVVAAASGNAGPIPYVSSSPGDGDAVISVAAVDSHAAYPGARVTLDDGTIAAQDSNGAPLTGALGVYVLRAPDGSISLGCDESEYVDALIAGRLVVTQRGICARISRAQFGQAHGAAAVALINNGPGYPPFEYTIDGVTIPFLGVLQSDSATLGAATAATSFASILLPNPTYDTATDFTSQGPRLDDSVLKPNVSAPGLNIFSAAIGTGSDGFYDSGTSMATPHVAGVAALATQAHRSWPAAAVSAAVVETADPTQLGDYWASLEGAGVVQAPPATRTQSVVAADTVGGIHALSYGFAEFTRGFRDEHDVVVRNFGNTPVTFNVTSTPTTGVPHDVHLSQTTVHVPPRGAVNLDVALSVPGTTVGATHDASGNTTFPEVAGNLTFMPGSPQMNGGVTLTLPYYLVPRARSNVLALPLGALTPKHPRSSLLLVNPDGAVTGNGDFYAWGLSGTPQGLPYVDTRAVGVQSNPISATDSVLVFAVNTFTRFQTLDAGEFDILIDVNGDGVPDYDLFNIDLGLLTSGFDSGQEVTALYRFADGSLTVEYGVDAPSNGSTVLLPVLASDLGLSPANPRFTYTEETFVVFSTSSSSLPGSASFNAFSPAISNALYVPVGPRQHATVPVAINPTEWANTPALGLMVVVEDNASGAPQATLLPVRSP